jgi:hypothetical protein
MTFTRPTADALNSHLASGGVIIIATYAKATEYAAKHAGMFEEGKDGCLYVRRGKGRICLSTGQRLLVGIRMGRYK